nr:receptor like protein 35 [Tanacetum cinerariifolium]
MLSNLAQLSLPGNNFKGTLPVSITNLTKLVELDLSENNFESTIPSQIGNLKNLLHLNLSDNQFSGLIPSSLGSMVNLAYLDLSRNNFFGSVPSSLGSMGDDTAFLLLYVDDIVLTASSDLTRDSSGMFLSQHKYAIEILEHAHMAGCNPSRTPVDTESKLGDGAPITPVPAPVHTPQVDVPTPPTPPTPPPPPTP